MLDVQVPGEDWRRIRPEQARAAKRSDPSLRSGPLELSSDMISDTIHGAQERSRTGSTASVHSRDSSASSAATPATSGADSEPLGDRGS